MRAFRGFPKRCLKRWAVGEKQRLSNTGDSFIGQDVGNRLADGCSQFLRWLHRAGERHREAAGELLGSQWALEMPGEARRIVDAVRLSRRSLVGLAGRNGPQRATNVVAVALEIVSQHRKKFGKGDLMGGIHFVEGMHEPTAHQHGPQPVDHGLSHQRMIAKHVLHESFATGKDRLARFTFSEGRLVEIVSVFLLRVGCRPLLVDSVGLQEGEQVL